MKATDSANPKGVPALVTGGTGFIGSHLVRLLLECGAPRVVATGVSGEAGNFDTLRDRVEVVRLDVGNFTDRERQTGRRQ